MPWTEKGPHLLHFKPHHEICYLLGTQQVWCLEHSTGEDPAQGDSEGCSLRDLYSYDI